MMMTLKQWRHGIVNSDLQASTRLVLHTLSHMSINKLGAYNIYEVLIKRIQWN